MKMGKVFAEMWSTDYTQNRKEEKGIIIKLPLEYSLANQPINANNIFVCFTCEIIFFTSETVHTDTHTYICTLLLL